jgi:hypothetical protein
MKAIALAFLISLFALSTVPTPAMAQDAAACETKAISKTGKALSGAAKTASIKKCMRQSCEAQAIGKNGKKLAGVARTSFLKKCEAAK